MAKSKRPPKKASGRPTVSVEEQLALALSDKVATKPERHTASRRPQVGDRVRLGSSETVYVVTTAIPNSKDVNLQFPGSNIERFRVPIEDLTFVDGPQPARSPQTCKAGDRCRGSEREIVQRAAQQPEATRGRHRDTDEIP